LGPASVADAPLDSHVIGNRAETIGVDLEETGPGAQGILVLSRQGFS